MSELALCTVVTRSHLAYARSLVQSFRAAHPASAIFVLVLDGSDGFGDSAREPFELVDLAELELPELRRVCFRYTALELSCAAKSWLIAHLLERRGVSRVVYLDADVLVLRPLTELERLLEERSIVLTPHFGRSFRDDGRKPGEREIMASGMYNAGFLAFRRDGAARQCLAWLTERVREQCVDDPARGLFVDQRWLDFIPGMFDGVEILRDPAYNAGYWSLAQRDFERREGELFVDRHPLATFHFSGLDLERLDKISRHQDRYALHDVEALRPLFERFRDAVLACGQEESNAWPYGFGRFSNGAPILREMRALYRELGDRGAEFGDPFNADGAGCYWAWLHQDVSPRSGVSRFWYHVHSVRPDLQRAFPDPLAAHRGGYLDWVRHHGAQEYPMAEAVVAPVESRAAGRVSPAFGFDSAAPPGINVTGNVRSEKGVGEALRATLRAVRSAEVPHVAIDYADPGASNTDKTTLDVVRHNPFPINLIHVNAEALPHFVNVVGRPFLRGKYNIGYWLWELPDLPRIYRASFDYLDEVWVASSYCQDAISKDSPVPVIKIPLALPPEAREPPRWGRERFGLPEHALIFLFIFDVESVLERKNPLGLLRAFARAFPTDPDVRLVLKIARGGQGVRRLLREASGNDDRVILLDRVLERTELHALIGACDCYVSLHRAEGFGLTIAEAMAQGKPVIATGYSGNADFMSPSNSFPVGYELVELERDFGPYPRGSRWAEPDLEQAARMMRTVYEDRGMARQVGERAAHEVWEYLSPESIGRRVRTRLAVIAPRSSAGRVATLFGR